MSEPRLWINKPPAIRWPRVLRIALLWLGVWAVVVLLPTSQPEVRAPASEAPQQPVRRAELPAKPPAAEKSGPTTVAGVARPLAADEVEACGGWRVKRLANPERNGFGLTTPEAKAARSRIIAALAGSGNEIDRVAGLVATLASTGIGAEGEAARADFSGRPEIDALARMATQTTDPRVYAVAFHACGSGQRAGEGACQMLSLEKWLTLDPKNAAPWVFKLNQAQQQRDAAGVEDALHHIAKAERSDVGWGLIPATIAARVQADEASALLPGAELVMAATSIQMASGLPGYQLVSAACRGDALRDANRRQTCIDIAEVLATRSSTVIEQAMGASIGKNVGWTDERVEELKRLRDAGSEAAARRQRSNAEPSSCPALRRIIADARDTARLGEVGAMRQWIDQSGSTVTQLAQAHRDLSQRVPRDAGTATMK